MGEVKRICSGCIGFEDFRFVVFFFVFREGGGGAHKKDYRILSSISGSPFFIGYE